MKKPRRRRKRKSDPDASPKPAPGHLRIVQDFLNTQDVDAQTDALPGLPRHHPTLSPRRATYADLVVTGEGPAGDCFDAWQPTETQDLLPLLSVEDTLASRARGAPQW